MVLSHHHGEDGDGHAAAQDVRGGGDAASGAEGDIDVYAIAVRGSNGCDDAIGGHAAEHECCKNPHAMCGDRPPARNSGRVWTVAIGIPSRC